MRKLNIPQLKKIKFDRDNKTKLKKVDLGYGSI